MVTRRQCVRRCHELGVTLEDDGSSLSVRTPRGKVLATTFCHMSARLYYDRGAWRKADAYDALLGEMCLGLVDCMTQECDYCTEAQSQG